jgi:DNA-binding SARP family transcriptional activator
MGALRIGVLGDFETRTTAGIIPIRGGKQRLLLASLALRPGSPIVVDELIDRIWEDNPPAAARTTLRSYVKRLRNQFREVDESGYNLIESVNGGYRLAVEYDDIDLNRFRKLRTQARNCGDPEQEIALLSFALTLWRGKPLSGLGPGRWLMEAAAGIEEELLQAAERRYELEVKCGCPGTAAAEMQRLVVQHPYRESLWFLMILGLHRSGRTAVALHKYERIRNLLADQLGVAPSRQLRSLHEQILREDNEPATDRRYRVPAPR